MWLLTLVEEHRLGAFGIWSEIFWRKVKEVCS